MIEWEWFSDSNTFHLFAYLLIKASYKESRFNGREMKVGQAVFGLHQANKDTGISVQSLRTSINRLKSTNEITVESTNKFSIVTILNYSRYQNIENDINIQDNNQTNKPSTSNQQATNNIQEVKKERSKEIPDFDSVKGFFQNDIMAANFFDYYQSNGWKVGKNPMKDWKAAARGWKSRQSNFSGQPQAGWVKP